MKQKTLFFFVFIALSPLFLCAESPKNTQKPSNYVVHKGDCLWNISKQLWKNPYKWPLLYAANQDKIKNPNLIYPSQKFTLPDIRGMTKADLKEATRLAYSKMGPMPSAIRVQKASPILKDRATSTSKPAPSEETSSTIQKPVEKSGVSTPPEKASPETAPVQGSGPVKPIMIVAFAAVALVAIVFFMRRKPSGSSPQVQQARSVSSFSRTETTPGSQIPSSANPFQPSSQPVTHPPQPQVTQPPMYSATITSVSVPSPAQPETKPIQSTPPPSATPPTTAPQGLPSPTPNSPPAQPAGENEPQRPPDNTPPASSSNHAA